MNIKELFPGVDFSGMSQQALSDLEQAVENMQTETYQDSVTSTLQTLINMTNQYNTQFGYYDKTVSEFEQDKDVSKFKTNISKEPIIPEINLSSDIQQLNQTLSQLLEYQQHPFISHMKDAKEDIISGYNIVHQEVQNASKYVTDNIKSYCNIVKTGATGLAHDMKDAATVMALYSVTHAIKIYNNAVKIANDFGNKIQSKIQEEQQNLKSQLHTYKQKINQIVDKTNDFSKEVIDQIKNINIQNEVKLLGLKTIANINRTTIKLNEEHYKDIVKILNKSMTRKINFNEKLTKMDEKLHDLTQGYKSFKHFASGNPELFIAETYDQSKPSLLCKALQNDIKGMINRDYMKLNKIQEKQNELVAHFIESNQKAMDFEKEIHNKEDGPEIV